MKHEALAFHAADADHGALTVGHLASVVLVVKLGEVEVRVLVADAVVSSVDAALGVSKEALGGVRGHAHAIFGRASVLFDAVIDGLVRREVLANLRVERRFVGVQAGFLVDVLLQELRDRFAGHMIDHARPHAASAFDERYDWRLVSHVATSPAAHLTTQVGLVSFYDAGELVRWEDVGKRKADTMAEEQGAVVGADLKLSLKLESRDLSLARAHHVERNQPLVQRDVAVFHHSSDGNGECVLALGALVHARSYLRGAIRGQRVDPGLVSVSAVWAASAVRPTHALEVRACGFFRREASHHGHQREVRAGCVLRCHDSNVPELYLWRNKKIGPLGNHVARCA